MADHVHAEFGAIEVQLINIDKKQDQIVKTVGKIFDRIEGKNGITSEIVALKTKYDLIPSFKTLVFYSGVFAGLTVAGFLVIKHLIG